MLTGYQASAGPGDKVDYKPEWTGSHVGMFGTDKAECLGVHLSKGLAGEGGRQAGLQRG